MYLSAAERREICDPILTVIDSLQDQAEGEILQGHDFDGKWFQAQADLLKEAADKLYAMPDLDLR